MITVILLGELGRRFGRRHRMAIASPAEAVRALAANFPAFEGELLTAHERGVGYRVLAGRDALSAEQLHDPSGQQSITIAPVLTGAGGSGLGQVLLGAVIIAVAWWNPMGWAAAGAFLSQATLYAVGTSMILGGVAQMLAPTPRSNIADNERPDNKPSYAFNGPVNTTAQGQPVPIGYGRLMVGSVVVSAGIDVVQVEIPPPPPLALGVARSSETQIYLNWKAANASGNAPAFYRIYTRLYEASAWFPNSTTTDLSTTITVDGNFNYDVRVVSVSASGLEGGEAVAYVGAYFPD